jgi:hypothetical protein
MELLILIVVVAGGFILYRFFSYRQGVRHSIRQRSGIEQVYDEAISCLEEEGLEVEDVTWDSVYLRHANLIGQIEAQIVIVGSNQAEITMGEQSVRGGNHKVSTKLKPNDKQRQVVRGLLGKMPHYEKIVGYSSGESSNRRSKSKNDEKISIKPVDVDFFLENTRFVADKETEKFYSIKLLCVYKDKITSVAAFACMFKEEARRLAEVGAITEGGEVSFKGIFDSDLSLLSTEDAGYNKLQKDLLVEEVQVGDRYAVTFCPHKWPGEGRFFEVDGVAF